MNEEKYADSDKGPDGIAEVTIRAGGTPRTFYLFDTPLGRKVFEKVLTGKSYPLQSCFGQIDTILDIGANIGAATVYFALHFPRARVLAFEPAPSTYALLVRNTQGLSKVEVFNVGLADVTRRASLYLGSQDSVTNSVCSSPENTRQVVEVQLRDAGTMMAALAVKAVDILKLDTEGCEVPILRSLAGLLPEIGVIFLEYHDEEDRLEIDRLLAATHLLCQGHVLAPHRGEFCYIAKSRLGTRYRSAQIRSFSKSEANPHVPRASGSSNTTN